MWLLCWPVETVGGLQGLLDQPVFFTHYCKYCRTIQNWSLTFFTIKGNIMGSVIEVDTALFTGDALIGDHSVLILRLIYNLNFAHSSVLMLIKILNVSSLEFFLKRQQWWWWQLCSVSIAERWKFIGVILHCMFDWFSIDWIIIDLDKTQMQLLMHFLISESYCTLTPKLTLNLSRNLAGCGNCHNYKEGSFRIYQYTSELQILWYVTELCTVSLKSMTDA